MIILGNSCKTKNKVLSTCLQGNYRENLQEFSNTSCGRFGAEKVKITENRRGCQSDIKTFCVLFEKPEIEMRTFQNPFGVHTYSTCTHLICNLMRSWHLWACA